MRNLKKILALVLALVMTFSVMVTANAFTDDESITDTYAVATEVLAGLKVFEGYEDGSFRPQGAITRAEVAAIIYRVVTGDVDDKQVGIYADYNKFTDVPATAWYAGYVNYCANAELIKGMGDGTFAPSANVTGYQALAMILRALGYDKMGEFTGAGWDIRTASAGKTLGITKNITAGTLGVAATREVVAEIIFQAIQVPTVSYTLLTGYAENDETLGDTFGLKYIDAGVLTANEYADLYGYEALAAGKSEIDGVTLNLSTDLTEIGLSYNVYYTGKTVLYIEDSGLNTAWENDGAATSLEKFKKVTGLNDGAEYFWNFDNAIEDYYTSEWKISYGDPDNLYEIPAGRPIYLDDYYAIAEIFAVADDDERTDNNADKYVVYVGTQEKEDASDIMSFRQFKEEYLEPAEYAWTYDDCVNGDWLKVIDNNGDGYADFVFKTTFEMQRVTGLSKKAVLSLTIGDDFGEYDETQVMDADEYVTSADLAVGDVVLTTYIDGLYYVELAPSFTGKVSKYTYKTETLTIEGEDYQQSDICEHTGYFNDITDAAKKTNYVWFQDFFGYIRAFAIPAGEVNTDLVLLNDAYFETNRSGAVYAVMAYLNGEWQDRDVANNKAGFITETESSNNDWGKLVTRPGDSKAETNMALYTEAEDGTLTLASAQSFAYDAKGNKTALVRDYIDLLNVDVANKQRTFDGIYNNTTGFEADSNDVLVQVNNSTEIYYYDQKTQSVTVVTGYKNIIAVSDELFDILAMYAVATNVDGDKNDDAYWVADAIVIETKYPVINVDNGLVLGYNHVATNVKDFGDLEVVLADGALSELTVAELDGMSAYEYDAKGYGEIATPAFYAHTTVDETDSYLESITEDFSDYGIYVVTIDREIDLDDYVVVAPKTYLDYTEDTIIYDIDVKTRYNSITDVDEYGDDLVLELGETYIIVSDGKGGIAYAILVDTATADLAALIVANP